MRNTTLDGDSADNRGDIFKQPVNATLYHYGFQPLKLERCFEEFQIF